MSAALATPARLCILGFAADDVPESPSRSGICTARRSLLSDSLRASLAAGGPLAHMAAAAGATRAHPLTGAALASDGGYDGDGDEEEEEEELDDEELSLLEGLDAAWSPSACSVLSVGTSTASSSRPIAIPAAT